mgnify:CR=1 FL=1
MRLLTTNIKPVRLDGFKLHTVRLNEWSTTDVAMMLFYSGMAVAYLGSMNPWFMWPLADKFAILSAVLLVSSYGVSNMHVSLRTNQMDYLLPTTAYFILTFYQIFIRGQNVNAYIVNIFYVITFCCLFMTRREHVKHFCDLMAKGMGGFLAVSMFFFLLYLAGFPLPSRDADFMNIYSFANYYFFLIDTRTFFEIIPRFHSVFLEPGHMGTMTALLLFTQIGRWRRWYNLSLLLATIISFSLAAYGLLVAIIFLGLWIQGKHILKQTLFSVAVIATIIAGSFVYNNGDNLLHDLIILRIEIDDGELAGDNRVTDSFKADYESLLQSSDVLVGRDRNNEEFGNSGYRVFIYDYGLIGLLFVCLFYLAALHTPHNMRAVVAVFIVGGMNFVVRGYPLWFANFLPLYYLARCTQVHMTESSSKLKTE